MKMWVQETEGTRAKRSFKIREDSFEQDAKMERSKKLKCLNSGVKWK